MTTIATFKATEIYAVTITASPRTFPRTSTDYTVTVVDYTGAKHAEVLLGSEAVARKLANTAWVALRDGVDAKKVWN